MDHYGVNAQRNSNSRTDSHPPRDTLTGMARAWRTRAYFGNEECVLPRSAARTERLERNEKLVWDIGERIVDLLSPTHVCDRPVQQT